MKEFVRRNPVSTFIALTLGFQLGIVLIAWALIPAGSHLHDYPQAHMVFRFRVFGPLFFAALITWWIEGGAGIRTLFKSFLNWRVPIRWYAMAASWKFIFTYIGMMAIAAFGVATWPGAVAPDFFWPLMKNMAFIVGIAVVEETSWMKFSVTRLHERYSALRTSLTVGLAWGLWYLPMVMIGEGVPDGVPWWVFLAGMFSLTVLLNWTFNMTRSGTVLLVMQIVSNCAFFITPVLPAWTGGPLFVSGFVAVFFLGSLFLLWKYGGAELGTGPRARWSEPATVHVPALAGVVRRP